MIPDFAFLMRTLTAPLWVLDRTVIKNLNRGPQGYGGWEKIELA